MSLSTLLKGEKVYLSAIEKDDLPTITKWFHDPDFIRRLSSQPANPMSAEQVQERIERHQKNDTDFSFGIRLVQNDELIGTIDLFFVQWTHGTAWLGVGIGAAELRGRGYGREAVELLLEFAFQELNLHRIQLIVYSYNENAIRLYETLGFQKEGIARESIHRDGQRFDTLQYGLLRREWEALRDKE